jgi:CheY-like chemotaxis protein
MPRDFSTHQPSSIVSIADNLLEKIMAQILIIDDNADHRAIFGRFIEYAGHRAIGAATASEGLACAQQHTPDMIVIDLRLPDMDGWALAGSLRSNPRTRRIPLLLTTAEPLNQARIADPAHEYDAILLKPFEARTFLAVIERLLAMPPSNLRPAITDMVLQRCAGHRCEPPPSRSGP